MTEEERNLRDQLTTYPDEEQGVRSMDILKSLDPLIVGSLGRRGAREIEQISEGRTRGNFLVKLSPVGDEMVRLGLIEEAEAPAGVPNFQANKWTRLTDKGRELARILTAVGPVPDWVLRGQEGRQP